MKRIKLEAKQTLATSNQAQHELKQKENELGMLVEKHRAELSSVEDRLRHETQARMFQQNIDISKLEEENQHLLSQNDSLMHERDTLAQELEAGQAGNLENLQLFQRELSRKMESAENADQSLANLQKQFVAYRNDKHA